MSCLGSVPVALIITRKRVTDGYTVCVGKCPANTDRTR